MGRTPKRVAKPLSQKVLLQVLKNNMYKNGCKYSPINALAFLQKYKEHIPTATYDLYVNAVKLELHAR